MYHTPEWYARLRDVGMLWQSLGGVAMFWAGVPKRQHWRWLFALYALASAALLLLSRTHGLLFLEQGSNVYIVYCLSVLLVLVCCRVSPWAALMVGSSGFLAQQICGSLELTFRSIPAIGALFDYSGAIVLLDILFFSAGYYVIWRTYHDKVFMEKEDIFQPADGRILDPCPDVQPGLLYRQSVCPGLGAFFADRADHQLSLQRYRLLLPASDAV